MVCAGHTNFSDSPLFAPGPLRKLQGAGDIDCVMFIDQVRPVLLAAVGAGARDESYALPQEDGCRTG